MNIRVDMTDQQYGSLRVIKYVPRKNMRCQNSHWLCECTCGAFLLVRGDNLRSGRTTQCSKCRNGSGRQSVFVKDVITYGVV